MAESADENQYLTIQQKAPAPCDSLLTGGCREGFSKPVPPYEPQSHDIPKAPAPCDSLPTGRCREGFSQPVPPYEPQSHNPQNTNNYRTSFIQITPCTSPPKGKKRSSALLQPGDNQPQPAPPEKRAASKSNAEIPGYKPEGGFLTIDDEIEGLSYLEKYVPMVFSEEYKSRLQLLKKIKEKGV